MLMSAPYLAWPVTLSVASWRIGVVPITLNPSLLVGDLVVMAGLLVLLI